VDERQERIGRNEALFRSVNGKLEDLNDAFSTVTSTFTVVCECGDEACIEQLPVDIREYEEVRSDPRLFIIYPGHVARDVEEVVEAREQYEVIRKRAGEPAALARDLDEQS
jgi:hypothetical protein